MDEYLTRRIAAFVLTLACAGCAASSSPRELRITATEYHFDAPAVAPAGLTAIRFHNAGRVRHEVILVRMKPGVTLKQLLATPMGPPTARDPVTEGGGAILIADAGDTDLSRILVDLVPGTAYALLCTLRDAPGARQHFALGMAATLRVQ